jgi:hypothetical protein
MPSSYEAAFIDRLPGMDNESLLRTLVRVTARPGDYRPEAIAAVKDAVARRHLTSAQQGDAENRAREEAREVLQDDAVSMALEGRSPSEIEARLKSRGLDEGTAAAIAKRAWDMPVETRRRAGRRTMISGAALCIVGTATTASSYYLAATSPGGGRYLIAWGMVLVGFVRVLRGWAATD